MKFSFDEVLNYKKGEEVKWNDDKPAGGNRKGFKIFSISTTVRNPNRNFDFLKAFEKYDGLVNDDNMLNNYYYDLIKKGIYQSINVPSSVKNAWDNNVLLTDQQVKSIIENNPQATGENGRCMTQLRALKDLSLVVFENSDREGLFNISISDFGKKLLLNPSNAESIYTKIMISMQGKSPIRTTILNESVPFLNTLFAIKSVNKKWSELGEEAKGIMNHEFGIFVLSMKDCDYEYAANMIIEYRKRFRFSINKDFISRYMVLNNILPVVWNTLLKDYPDEVFRKFELTGLFNIHGSHGKKYIDFSEYNEEKIKYILEKHSNYSYVDYKSVEEYLNSQRNIQLPWESNDSIRRKIVNSKAGILGLTLDVSKTLDENEKLLDSLFFSRSLKKAVEKITLEKILKELSILAGNRTNKSTIDLPDSLKLEYLLALLLGKVYGTEGVVSNLIYNEEGFPIHCAGGNKCDLSFHHEDGSYIFELTMLKSKDQILNSETTNIVRHAKDEERKYNIEHRVLMVAPRIHIDVARYFRYEVKEDEARIIPLTINKTGNLIKDSSTVKKLNENYDKYISNLLELNVEDFVDFVNNI